MYKEEGKTMESMPASLGELPTMDVEQNLKIECYNSMDQAALHLCKAGCWEEEGATKPVQEIHLHKVRQSEAK
jgi:hypothetical protein